MNGCALECIAEVDEEANEQETIESDSRFRNFATSSIYAVKEASEPSTAHEDDEDCSEVIEVTGYADMNGELRHTLNSELTSLQLSLPPLKSMLEDDVDADVGLSFPNLESQAMHEANTLRSTIDSLRRELEVERESKSVLAAQLEEQEQNYEILQEANRELTRNLRKAQSGIPKANASKKRMSIAMFMEKNNSMGVSAVVGNDVDEVDIVKDNVFQHLRALQLNLDENGLLTHMVESLVTEYHLAVTLRDKGCVGTVPSDSGLMSVLRAVHSRVTTFVSALVTKRTVSTDTDLLYPVKWLLNTFPDAAERGKGRGWLPLHWLLVMEEDDDVSAMMVMDRVRKDSGCESTDGEGSAVDGETDGGGASSSSSSVRKLSNATAQTSAVLRELQVLYEVYADDAYQQPVSPLSAAVAKSKPRVDVVRYLLQRRPTAVLQTDSDGSLPLMHACATNDTHEVVQLLIEADEEMAVTADKFGCYSIHYACYSGSASVVRYLLQTHPTLVSQVSGNGSYPLHDAVQNLKRGAVDIVRMVLEAYPFAATQPDLTGALPLHHAAKWAGLEVVQLVFEAYRQAVYVVDVEGLLPMHYAAERGPRQKNLSVVQFILQANPMGTVGFPKKTSSSSSSVVLSSSSGDGDGLSSPSTTASSPSPSPKVGFFSKLWGSK